MEYETSANGKILRAGGSDDPRYRVLCLPGGLCTARFYDDVLAASALAAGGIRAFATTLPGFGGVPFPAGFDASPEAHAAYAGELARDLDCDAVVGHSFGANVALEMAAGGHFDPATTKVHKGPEGGGHKGDLPKLEVSAKGDAGGKLEAKGLKLADFDGKSLMIHAGGDNYSDTPKPNGGGGDRIVCGVVPAGK